MSVEGRCARTSIYRHYRDLRETRSRFAFPGCDAVARGRTMNPADLFLQVESYIGFRHAIGYTIHSEERLLKDFVLFLDSRKIQGVIRSQMAIDWACTPAPGILPPIRRPVPYLYSAGEIDTLLNEASRLGPKDSLRPYTYCTLIGLLASSGLRVGEALRSEEHTSELQSLRHIV